MTVNVIGTAQPIYMIGESHCVAFDNTVFQWRSKELFLCRSRFIRELRAYKYTDKDNQLHPGLTDVLKTERLLDDRGIPKFISDRSSGASIGAAHYSVTGGIPPAMVFFAGDLDLHHDLLKAWGEHDFILPDDEIYGFNRNKTPISVTAVCKKIESIFLPFTTAMVQLRDKGFSRLMIHCLPARAKNIERFPHLDFDNIVRVKVTIVANSYLAQFCQRENMGYIDTWSETTKDGYLRDDFDLDGVHLTKNAAHLSFEKIMQHLHREAREKSIL